MRVPGECGLQRGPFLRVVAAAAAAAILAGCITFEKTGSSSAETKRAMEESFLFASAEIFYPAGAPEDPGRLSDLGKQAIAELQRQMSSTLAGLLREHGKLHAALAEVFERPIPAEARATVALVNTGRPVARIAGDGEISLDAKVVQAMFRAALVSTFETEILLARVEAGKPAAGPVGESAEEQDIAVRAMLALKARVEAMEGRSALGEVLGDTDLRGAQEGGTGWFAMQDLARVSNDAERSYDVQQILLLAHELGHVVLGHQGLDHARLDCEGLAGLEQEADLYAALVLALATRADSVQDLLGMFGKSLGEGLEDLFAYAYEFAGFEAASVTARCPPRAPEERLRAVREAYGAVRSAQIDALLKEAHPE